MAKQIKRRSNIQVIVPDFVPAYHSLWGFAAVDRTILDRLPEPLSVLQFQYELSKYVLSGANKFTFWYRDSADGFVLSEHIYAEFFIA